MKKMHAATVAMATMVAVGCSAQTTGPAAQSAPAAQQAKVAVQTVAPGQTAISATGGKTMITFGPAGINQVVHQSNLPTAIMNNDATAIYNAGLQMQKYEARAKAVDKVYNSQNVFHHAAIVAAGQNNVPLMQQIVTVAPQNQVLMQQMTITRGAKKDTPAAIPQLVEVSFGGWDKLTNAQQPIWGDYIMAFYPAMNRQAAEIFANKVNSSRSMMAPALLAEAAVDLGKFEGKNVPAAFQAKNVFSNAVDMALFLNDKDAMQKIVALYDKASFKDAKVAKDLASELKGMSAKRSVTYIKSRGRTQMAFGPGGLCGYMNDGENSIKTFTGRAAQAEMMMRAYSDNW